MKPSNFTLQTSPLIPIYRRVSTDHQANSLDLQEAGNLDYLQRHALGQPQLFDDPDTSGGMPFLQRPGGRGLMEFVARHRPPHVVTAKQDRLGRDTLDQINVIRALWAAGITPHFSSEGGALPRTDQNELMFEIKASVAQYERNLIRSRTRDTLRHKRGRGELVGTVPYGYDVIYTFTNGHKISRPVALFFGGKKLVDGVWSIRPAEPEASTLLSIHGHPAGKTLADNIIEQQHLLQIALWRWGSLTLARDMCASRLIPHSALRTPHLGPAGEKIRGTHSYKWIADRLNAGNVRAKAGGQWQCGNVDGVLSSRYTLDFLNEAIAAQALDQSDPSALSAA